MIREACTAFAVARIVPVRKFFPIACEPSLNENASNIGAVYETLSDDTALVCWL
jgi:hypothetical protein